MRTIGQRKVSGQHGQSKIRLWSNKLKILKIKSLVPHTLQSESSGLMQTSTHASDDVLSAPTAPAAGANWEIWGETACANRENFDPKSVQIDTFTFFRENSTPCGGNSACSLQYCGDKHDILCFPKDTTDARTHQCHASLIMGKWSGWDFAGAGTLVPRWRAYMPHGALPNDDDGCDAVVPIRKSWGNYGSPRPHAPFLIPTRRRRFLAKRV
jgi:hypothetical protein